MGGDPLRVRLAGPLEPYGAGFAQELARLGYTRHSTADQLRLLAHLSRWLGAQGRGPADLTTEVGDVFLVARRTAGYTLWLSRRALEPLLHYLREIGAVPPVPIAPRGPCETLLARFGEYLAAERGLTSATANGYVHWVDPFLRQRQSSDGTLRLADLSAADITAFVVAALPGRSIGSAKMIVTSLRSLLGFLHVDGRLDHSLLSAVPSVAGSRLAGLPKALAPGQLGQLMGSCDRTSAVGRRDFAVVTMLGRLGLRAGELVALELADVDWRGGEIVVRGKGNRHERLPLPVDVGRALSAHLRGGRPTSECRRLFLGARAPHRGITSSAVSAIVSGAARKSGLPPMSSHRLRHTAATELLRAGASLSQVGQVLRHRSALSTAIYAKVDRLALRQIARPWPAAGGAA